MTGAEFSKVAGQFGRRTRQKISRISRGVRRNQHDDVGPGLDEPLSEFSECLPGASNGLEALSSDLRNKQWRMRSHTRKNDPARHSWYLLLGCSPSVAFPVSGRFCNNSIDRWLYAICQGARARSEIIRDFNDKRGRLHQPEA